MHWQKLSRRLLEGGSVNREEALSMLQSGDNELLAMLDAAFIIRRYYFGRGVGLHVIRNARSGSCSEDCSFCSQSILSKGDIPRYPLVSAEELIEGARRAHGVNAKRYCIVTGGRMPSKADLDAVCEAVRKIKHMIPIEICTSLGLLTPEQARELKAAGVDRYNHNLESSGRFFSSVCTSHSHADRVGTVRSAKTAGMEICSGGIIGMGESLEDRVALAFELRDLSADSIPLNFFNPRPGTPLEGVKKPSPGDCLRALAMFRFVSPEKEIRVAGGREFCLGHLQALSLFVADSMFTNGYLTTPGMGYEADMAMIDQAGFRVTEYID